MKQLEKHDYKNRSYLSAIESAKFLGIRVKDLHNLVKKGVISTQISASGQMRFHLSELTNAEQKLNLIINKKAQNISNSNVFEVNGTVQRILVKNSVRMDELESESIHLMITSPPYFNTKMYSKEPIEGDLGNIHDIDKWFEKISEVWKEVFRVLQPGRKAFINIVPDNLDGIFKVCFILDNINRIPKNINLWLTYLLTFVNEKNALSEIYKILYCLDFLYSNIDIGNLRDNEINNIIKSIKQIDKILKRCYQCNSSYVSSSKDSPFEETRYALFSINLLEDLIQDLIYNYEVKDLKPIKRIYQSLNNFSKTYDFVINNQS